MLSWLRLYTEIVADRKLRRHSTAVRWAWITMMCVARQSPEPGRLLIGEGVPATPEDLADIGALRVADVRRAITIFEEQGMLAKEGAVMIVINWGRRQFESDDVTARVRKHREKRGIPETPMKRFSNRNETPPDPDTDPDSEGEGKGTPPPSPPPPALDDDPAKTSPVHPGVPPGTVVNLWNEICGDLLPRVLTLTDKRRTAIQARARLPDRDEAWWRKYFGRIRATPFCCGENDRRWVADFWFAVRSEDSIANVFEGKYDRRGGGGGGPGGSRGIEGACAPADELNKLIQRPG